MAATKVLMVCLGNICRSPLAEGILKSKIKDSQNIIVDSAGTGAYHIGKLPDSRSIAVAKTHGIDITDQRARKVDVSDLDSFDYIFTMDEVNYRNVIALAENKVQEAKVFMMMNELQPGENISVPDPYYGGDHGFEHVYQMLDKACDVFINKIS